ncbi:hypothetical protein pb186bvf_015970 [Paramecium bursaria]
MIILLNFAFFSRFIDERIRENQKLQFLFKSLLFQMNASRISKNERYLAYGGWERVLVLYDLNSNKEVKKIKMLLNQCMLIQFRLLILFIGCEKGYIYCIDIANYKQIYYQQLHKDFICNIIEQTDYVIITRAKTDIAITNVKEKYQIKRIENAHSDWINGLYYDIPSCIISASQDRSIKFYNTYSELFFIQKYEAHEQGINKIQLIDDHKLLSLSGDGLKCWQVDYKNQNLVLLRQIKDFNEIRNFDPVNPRQILITKEKIFQVFDEDFKMIKQIKHSQNDDVWFRITNQLLTMNYLLICGESTIYLQLIEQLTIMKRLCMTPQICYLCYQDLSYETFFVKGNKCVIQKKTRYSGFYPNLFLKHLLIIKLIISYQFLNRKDILVGIQIYKKEINYIRFNESIEKFLDQRSFVQNSEIMITNP